MATPKRYLDIRTTPLKAGKSGWVLCSSLLLAAVAIWAWLALPKAGDAAKVSRTESSLLATAPTPDYLRPLNADGAPRSE